MTQKSYLKLSGITKHSILIIIAFIIISPIFWLLIQSFKTYLDTIAIPPKIIFSPILDNYRQVILGEDFGKAFRDSLVVGLTSVGITLLIGIPCSYALARFKFKGQSNISFIILSTYMMPPIVVIVPFIRIFHALRISDTYIGLIIAHILLNLALVVWVMRSFFNGIPREVEEAAMIDGCSEYTVFYRVTLPLAAPGVIVTALLSFLFSWNDLLYGLCLTSENIQTLPVYMGTTFIGFLIVEWGLLSAASIIVLLPSVIFVILMRKHLARGMTLGAVG